MIQDLPNSYREREREGPLSAVEQNRQSEERLSSTTNSAIFHGGYARIWK
jgi:hypothetical protein